jgi:hypothetical protein
MFMLFLKILLGCFYHVSSGGSGDVSKCVTIDSTCETYDEYVCADTQSGMLLPPQLLLYKCFFFFCFVF